MRLLPISGIVALASNNFFSTQSIPINCLTTSPTPATLEDLVTCFETFTVRTNTYDATTYASAQPSPSELAAWTTVIESLLDVDGNCTSVSPTNLTSFYTVSLFTESVVGGQSFCILSESNSEDNHYVRGWGLVAVPATRAAVTRNIHFSAPHPINDSRTAVQAAALFKRTGAKSLVITGRQRDAYKIASSCQTEYFKTDAAHDIVRHFFCVCAGGCQPNGVSRTSPSMML